MRFSVTLDKEYFNFAKQDALSFDGWADNAQDTFYMEIANTDGKFDIDFFPTVLAAVQVFNGRCNICKFNPTPGIQIGIVTSDTGFTFPILSR